jgi:hypothetical protein
MLYLILGGTSHFKNSSMVYFVVIIYVYFIYFNRGLRELHLGIVDSERLQ